MINDEIHSERNKNSYTPHFLQNRIYNGEREKPLIDAILEFYGVDKKELPEDMMLSLNIF